MKYIYLILTSIALSFSVVFSTGKSDNEAPYLSLLLKDLEEVEQKAIGLAEEFGEDKYNWRPAEGIRSVSEIFVHICSANYWILSLTGAKIPESFGRDAEQKITEKSEVIKTLKNSYESAKQFINNLKPEELNEVVKTSFGEFTKRKLVLMLVTHSHEHVGQAIAYARSNGVVPPWSKKK